MWRMSLHRNYVCFFSNGTFKIGVTKNPIGRLAAYVREATRFDRHVTGFWTSPLREKGSAYALETAAKRARSEEHTSELQSLMRISYAVFCLKKKKIQKVQSYHMRTTIINRTHCTE